MSTRDEELTVDDWLAIIKTMRAAPLRNMDHAEAVDKLLDKVCTFAGLKPKLLPQPEKTKDEHS